MLEEFNRILQGTYQDYNGITYTHLEQGRAGGELIIGPKHLNPNGAVHGAVLVALADSVAMAGCVYTYELLPATTTSLAISYIRAVRSGKITAEATCLSRGRTVSAWQVECKDDEDRLLAVVQINFALIKPGSTVWEKQLQGD